MQQMARNTYTDEQRAEAVALYREHGAAEAARLCGVTAGTIRSWASRGDVATERHDRQVDNIAAAAMRWEERRTEMVHKIGEVAAKALQQVEAELDDGKLRNAKDAATTMAILVDKAQVLSGGASVRYGSDTDRHAVVTQAREQALRLVG